MKILITSIAILALISMTVGVASNAANEASVSATVTVEQISVSVSNGIVAYETLAVNTSKDTTSASEQLNNTQIATNDGNVTVDLNIRGTDSTPWTLAATAGSDLYVHEFCKVDTGDCDSSPAWTPLTTSNQTLEEDLAATGTYDFDLKITTPTISTSYTEQSVNVTVLASASTP